MDICMQDVNHIVLTSTLNGLIVLSHKKRFLSRNRLFKENNTKKPCTSCGVDPEKCNLPTGTLNDIKLDSELKKLVHIYTNTMEDLQIGSTIQLLLETINQHTKRKKQEGEVIQKNSSNTSDLRHFKFKLTEFKSVADDKVLKASKTLNGLKFDWRIISKINELEYELVRNWEHTRFTQAIIVGEKEKEILEKQFTTLLLKTTTEQRVIFNFESFSRKQLNKYSELIATRKNKYTKEYSELQLNIADKKKKIKELNKTYEKHLEIFCKRRMFMIEYLEQKAEQNYLHQLQVQRIDSAVKIQAWWRGLMVRRCLGPFRKKTKKSKKGKKGK